ncbi:MAG: hypothetical protein LBE04_00385 [Prevotellaceae bacterium]|jgi:hypothetical protein|nr:hypothetical protein [Prevotellaceae bacterium]
MRRIIKICALITVSSILMGNKVYAQQKSVDDIVFVMGNKPVTFDVLKNDISVCDRKQAVIKFVENPKLSFGKLSINSDNTFTYQLLKDMSGVESVEYSVKCGTTETKAKIYFVVSRPLSLNYVACPTVKLSVEMSAIQGVEYYWYSVSAGGTPTQSPSNTYSVTKDNSAVQSYYVEARYKGATSGRYQISLLKSDDCGNIAPKGCAVNGQLLFLEDFGGNDPGDNRISRNPLPSSVTTYTFQGTDKIHANQYTLLKYIDPSSNYAWQKNFSDHTHSDNRNRGYMFLVDASDLPGKFYEKRITDLCDNINSLYFSVWALNVIPSGSSAVDDPMLKFELRDDNNNIIATYLTPSIPRDKAGEPKWRNYGFAFDPKGYHSLTLRIYNNRNGSNGNDFALDDIEIRLCVPPVTVITKLVDTVCYGTSYTFEASYEDDGTFSSSGKPLEYQWQYSPVNTPGAKWTAVNKGTESSKKLDTKYTMNNINESDEGYYRLAVANSSTIDHENCRVVSQPIHLYVKTIKANNDVAIVTYNQPKIIDVLANDSMKCCPDLKAVKIDTVAGSGLRRGSLRINSDNTLTYTARNNVFGIDSVDYTVEYLSVTKRARVYIVMPKPLSLYNTACPTTEITIGMEAIPGVQYYWYDVPVDGTPLSKSPADSYLFTKNNSDVQSWYVEARYKGEKSERYQISLLKSDNCGSINPTGCVVDGQLLFREDFGGNNVGDNRTSQTKLPPGVTDYQFLNNEALKQNQYALVKFIDPNLNYAWQKNFSDHTHPNDFSRGYMFLVDAADNPGKFYEKRITGLCDNINSLYFSVWTLNVIPKNSSATDDPMLKFELRDDNDNIIATYLTPKIPRDTLNRPKWRNYGFAFDPKGFRALTLRIYNNGAGSKGNDFALDDIEVRLCVPPITVTTKLVDTVCYGTSYTFNASYEDDGTFTSSGKPLEYHWQYSPVNTPDAKWTAVNKVTENSTKLEAKYTMNNIKESDTGYYRLAVANSATIDHENCRVVSKPVRLYVKTIKANNDVAIVTYNQPKIIDVLANDSMRCCTDLNALTIDTVAGSGLRRGSLRINPDKTLTYTAGNNVFGIDSVDYTVEYLSVTKRARIYIVMPKPLSVYNIACPGVNVAIGMEAIPDVKYYWYNAPAGGTPLFPTLVNTCEIVKDDSDVQSLYVEAEYKGYLSTRYQISIFKSDNCGEEKPTGCAIDGSLLFREDFGGNDHLDPRISKTPLPDNVTEYNFQSTTDQLSENQYALVKYINPHSRYAWQKNFSDHTHPNDLSRGYMFLVDASKKMGKFYETRITGLCDSINRLYFSAWVFNVIPDDNTTAVDDPMLKFELWDDNNNLIARYLTSTLHRDKNGQAKWKSFGFTFDPKGFRSLTLRIYNNKNGSNGNDFALDDIEVRLCVPPITVESKLNDTVCDGAPFQLKASYTDNGIFTGSSNELAYRWEHSADGTNWSIVGKDTTVTSTVLQSIYAVAKSSEANDGYYRFIVSKPSAINNPTCRIVSGVMSVNVLKTYSASDIRVMIAPSNAPHAVYLTSFIDTLNVESVKWTNSVNKFPKFLNDATGELDAHDFLPKSIYTFKYTTTSRCGSSSAKAYLFASIDKLPLKDNTEIFICKDLPLSQHVNLNQILGVENNGTWLYPNDKDSVIFDNVKVSSIKYGASHIFNAQKAYSEAGTSYDSAKNPTNKAFKFRFVAPNGKTINFTLIVGK